MDDTDTISVRQKNINQLKLLLNNIDDKLKHLTEELNWNIEKLVDDPANMVTCSINSQHTIPATKVQIHEEKCFWHHMGYLDEDLVFPDYSGAGSFVTLTPDLIQSITQNISPHKEKHVRPVPQSSANFDQNFDREEKLAIYDYVIKHTQKQRSYSDLGLHLPEKTKEKREMTALEIAAAERDAKRRTASYRNKVHTNRKTHTEILREVIQSQMDSLIDAKQSDKSKSEGTKQSDKSKSEDVGEGKKYSNTDRSSSYKRKSHYEGSSSHFKKYDDKRWKEEKYIKHSEHDKSLSGSGNEKKFRSRSQDKFRKWKKYEGRSNSHRSSHAHSRR